MTGHERISMEEVCSSTWRLSTAFWGRHVFKSELPLECESRHPNFHSRVLNDGAIQ